MKFLCLHGMGTSSTILESQLANIVSIMEDDGHEFVFLDGLLECDTGDEISAIFPGPYLCYYSMPKKEQVIAAQEYIRDVMEDDGPFDGVIGFSQGAALASSMMLEHMKTNPKGDLFDLCIFAGASLPFDLDNGDGLKTWLTAKRTGQAPLEGEFDGEISKEDPPGFPTAVHDLAESEKLLGRYHPSRSNLRIHVPTLHIMGDADPYLGQCRALAGLCNGDSVVLAHKEGHTIPRDLEFQRKVAAALTKLIDRSLLCRH